MIYQRKGENPKGRVTYCFQDQGKPTKQENQGLYMAKTFSIQIFVSINASSTQRINQRNVLLLKETRLENSMCTKTCIYTRIENLNKLKGIHRERKEVPLHDLRMFP